LAEQWFGEGRCVDHFVCLGIRSGIGAGVIVDGRLHRGHDDLAGEIGGWPCETGIGNREMSEGRALPGPTAKQRTVEVLTLEQVASVRAILAALTDAVRAGATTSLVLKRNQVTLEEMLRAANDSDPLVLQVIDRAARAVGRVIDQLGLLLNPQKVIVAGPLAELSEAFLQPVTETVDHLATPLHAKPPRIVASRFGAFGGALGAAALAVHQWKPTR
jgi:glucokinase